jgi:hypothetical protein
MPTQLEPTYFAPVPQEEYGQTESAESPSEPAELRQGERVRKSSKSGHGQTGDYRAVTVDDISIQEHGSPPKRSSLLPRGLRATTQESARARELELVASNLEYIDASEQPQSDVS